MGLLKSEPKGTTNYEGQIPVAGNLKGHILLVQGTLDQNSPPYGTLRDIAALIHANRDFDLLLLPNERHQYSLEVSTYVVRRAWDYFVRYLLGMQPPEDFEMHIPETTDVTGMELMM